MAKYFPKPGSLAAAVVEQTGERSPEVRRAVLAACVPGLRAAIKCARTNPQSIAGLPLDLAIEVASTLREDMDVVAGVDEAERRVRVRKAAGLAPAVEGFGGESKFKKKPLKMPMGYDQPTITGFLARPGAFDPDVVVDWLLACPDSLVVTRIVRDYFKKGVPASASGRRLFARVAGLLMDAKLPGISPSEIKGTMPWESQPFVVGVALGWEGPITATFLDAVSSNEWESWNADLTGTLATWLARPERRFSEAARILMEASWEPALMMAAAAHGMREAEAMLGEGFPKVERVRRLMEAAQRANVPGLLGELLTALAARLESASEDELEKLGSGFNMVEYYSIRSAKLEPEVLERLLLHSDFRGACTWSKGGWAVRASKEAVGQLAEAYLTQEPARTRLRGELETSGVVLDSPFAEEVVLRMPGLLETVCSAPDLPVGRLVITHLMESLGADTEQWEIVLGLAHEWDGSVNELVASVAEMVGAARQGT